VCAAFTSRVSATTCTTAWPHACARCKSSPCGTPDEARLRRSSRSAPTTGPPAGSRRRAASGRGLAERPPSGAYARSPAASGLRLDDRLGVQRLRHRSHRALRGDRASDSERASYRLGRPEGACAPSGPGGNLRVPRLQSTREGRRWPRACGACRAPRRNTEWIVRSQRTDGALETRAGIHATLPARSWDSRHPQGAGGSR
jgi:hypothetical protein